MGDQLSPQELVWSSPFDPELTAGTDVADTSCAPASPWIGRVLGGQYRIVERIGEGGMAAVYRALHIGPDRDVAVKVLRRELAGDERSARRFENEARAIAKLRHPNTIRLFDCQRTEDGTLFIVTELLHGRPLSQFLLEERADLARAIRILEQVCRSLSEAHAVGIIHRDIKPGNIFLDRVGTEDVVKVIDFGIAKVLDEDSKLTRPGISIGTPLYMPPEQVGGRGRIDHRSDIYSLGATFYHLFSGQPPFKNESLQELVIAHVFSRPPSIRERCPEIDCPPELDQLVLRMLAKSPDDRPQSADEILDEIFRLSSELRLRTDSFSRLNRYESAAPRAEISEVRSTAPQASIHLKLGVAAAAALVLGGMVALLATELSSRSIEPVEVESRSAIETRREAAALDLSAAPIRAMEDERVSGSSAPEDVRRVEGAPSVQPTAPAAKAVRSKPAPRPPSAEKRPSLTGERLLPFHPKPKKLER
jgi:serine/threonine protein kinase